MTDCTHHWTIESPNGPTSQASCKLCGQTKVFFNGYKRSAGAYNAWAGRPMSAVALRDTLPAEDYDG